MNPIELVIVFYSIIYYHLVYKIMSILEDRIVIYYRYITNYMIWLIYVSFSFLVTYISGTRINIFYIGTFYLFNTFMISRIEKNYDYLMLGILFSLFQSEFWEVPIYLYQYSFIETNIGIIPLLLKLITIISKLSVIFYIFTIMRKLNFNIIQFIEGTFSFFTVYSIIVFVIYNLGLHMEFMWILRFSCSLFFYLFLFIQNRLKYNERIE